MEPSKIKFEIFGIKAEAVGGRATLCATWLGSIAIVALIVFAAFKLY